jgi:serine/threonine protein phosphatase PrpC
MANAEEVPELSVGEVALGSLIDDAHTLHPDDLLEVVRRKGRMVGLDDIDILVCDRDQVVLRSLDPTHADDQSIDGTMAGRCYQRSEVVSSDNAEDGQHQVWFPILDGTARMGVMSASVRDGGALVLRRGNQLAGIVTFLLVAKSQIGDAIVRASDAKPLSLAAEMRWATIPPLAFEHGPVAIGAMLEPAYEIAGDTFDYAIDGSTLHLAIFDAVGHGLQSSQLASLAVYAYRRHRRDRLSLEELYRTLDGIIGGQYSVDHFVTAQLATLDLETGHLHCVNAGHPRPLLLREQTNITEIPFDACVPLGLGNTEVMVTDATLQPGDTVVFLSDGVLEARDANGEMFGVARLSDHLVRAAAGELTPSEAVRRASHAVVAHHGGNLDDDATMLLVRWHGHGRTS